MTDLTDLNLFWSQRTRKCCALVEDLIVSSVQTGITKNMLVVHKAPDYVVGLVVKQRLNVLPDILIFW